MNLSGRSSGQPSKGDAVKRVFMFCYPRVLGYVFNPLTVYYGVDSSDRLCLMIYEVNNTFGERHCYVIPVDESGHAVL